MAANNQVVIIGRVGNDVAEEMKYLQSGTAKAEARVAVNRPVKDEMGNPVTDWISCVFWSKQAELMADLVKKGDLISVTGSLRVDKWESGTGEKRQKYYVNGEGFQMLESKTRAQERRAGEGGMGSPAPAAAPSRPAAAVDDFDDSLVLEEDELPPF